MSKKNIKKLLLLTTMLGLGGAVYSQSYMCLPCPTGTWSDGLSGECVNIGDILFEEEPFKKLEKAETSSISLDVGCYKVKVVGAGGGGSWDYYNNPSGAGGSGYREEKSFCAGEKFEFEYTVGASGKGYQNSGGPRGGTSKFGIDNLKSSLQLYKDALLPGEDFWLTGEGGFGGSSTGGNGYGLGGAGYEKGGDRGGNGGGPDGGCHNSSGGFNWITGTLYLPVSNCSIDGKLGGGGAGCKGDCSNRPGYGGDGYIYIYKAI